MRAALMQAVADASGCRGESLHGPGPCRVCRAKADAFLPTVRHLAAEEVRAAAEYVNDPHDYAQILARADVLDSTDPTPERNPS